MGNGLVIPRSVLTGTQEEPVLGTAPVDPSTGLTISRKDTERAVKLGQYDFNQVLRPGGLTPPEQRLIGDKYKPQFGEYYKEQQLAEEQSFGDQLFNSLSQTIIGTGVGQTLESVGYLLDLPMYASAIAGTEKDFGNAISRLGVNIQEGIQQAAPIYRSPDAKEFNPADASWWLLNLPSIASTISLFIPTEFLMRGIGEAGRLMKLGLKLSKNDRWMLNGLVQAGFSRHAESLMEGRTDGEQVMQHALDRGLSFNEARELAAKSMANTYKKNWILYFQDLPEYLFYGKLKAKGFSKAMRDMEGEALSVTKAMGIPLAPVLTKKGVSALSNMLGEFGEEGLQYLINNQSQAMYWNAITGEEIPTIWQEFKGSLDDGGFWTNATMGALGAGAMMGVAPLFHQKARNEANKKRIEQIKQWPAKFSQLRQRLLEAEKRQDPYEEDVALTDFVSANVSSAITHGNANWFEEFISNLAEAPEEIATKFNISKEELEFYKQNPDKINAILDRAKDFRKRYTQYYEEALNFKKNKGNTREKENNASRYALLKAHHAIMRDSYNKAIQKLNDDIAAIDISKEGELSKKFDELTANGQQFLLSTYDLEVAKNVRNSYARILKNLKRRKNRNEADEKEIERLQSITDNLTKQILPELRKAVKEASDNYTEEDQKEDEGFEPDPKKLAQLLELKKKLSEFDDSRDSNQAFVELLDSGKLDNTLFPKSKKKEETQSEEKQSDIEVKIAELEKEREETLNNLGRKKYEILVRQLDEALNNGLDTVKKALNVINIITTLNNQINQNKRLATPKLIKKINDTKDKLSKLGYEIFDKTGDKYDEGINGTFSFRFSENEDESNSKNERRVITRIGKPQVNLNGEMVQSMTGVVTKGYDPEVDSRTGEDKINEKYDKKIAELKKTGEDTATKPQELDKFGGIKKDDTIAFKDDDGKDKLGKVKRILPATKNEKGEDIEPFFENEQNAVEVDVLDEEGQPIGVTKTIPFSKLTINTTNDTFANGGVNSDTEEGEFADEISDVFEEPWKSIDVDVEFAEGTNLLSYTHYDAESGKLIVRNKALGKWLSDKNNSLQGSTATYSIDLQSDYNKEQLTKLINDKAWKKFSKQLKILRDNSLEKIASKGLLSQKDIDNLLNTRINNVWLSDILAIDVSLKAKDKNNKSKTFTGGMFVTTPSKAANYLLKTNPSLNNKSREYHDTQRASRKIRSSIISSLLTGNNVKTEKIQKGVGVINKTSGKDYNRKANVAETLGVSASAVKLGVSTFTLHSGSQRMKIYVNKGKAIEEVKGATTRGGVYAITEDTANGKPYAIKLNKTHISEEHAGLIFEAFVQVARSAFRKERGQNGKRVLKKNWKSLLEKGFVTFEKGSELWKATGGLNMGEFLSLMIYHGKDETSLEGKRYKVAKNLDERTKQLIASKQLYLTRPSNTNEIWLVYGVNENGVANAINLSDYAGVREGVEYERLKFVKWVTENKTYPVYLERGKLNLELNGQFLTDKESGKPIPFRLGKDHVIERTEGETYAEFLIKNNLVTTDVIPDENGKVINNPGVNLNLSSLTTFKKRTRVRKPPVNKTSAEKKETPSTKEEISDIEREIGDALDDLIGNKPNNKDEKPRLYRGDKKYDQQDLEKELNFLKNKLGITDVNIVKKLIKLTSNGRLAWATHTLDAITLYEAAEKGSLYHEAFHRFIGGYLTQYERSQVIKTARSFYRMDNASDNDVEERIAEEFRRYVLDRDERKQPSFLTRVFRSIVEFIERIFFSRNRIALNDIERLFDQIYTGKFKNYKILQENLSAPVKVAPRLFSEYGFNYINRKEFKELIADFATALLGQQDLSSFSSKFNLNYTKLYDKIINYQKVLLKAIDNPALSKEEKEKYERSYAIFDEILGEEVEGQKYRSNFPHIIREINKYLSSVGFRAVYLESELDEYERTGATPNWDRASYETDIKENALGAVKFLIMSLPSNRINPITGKPSKVEPNTLWNAVLNDLHDALSIEEMINRLETISASKDESLYVPYKELANRLREGSKQLRNQFFTSVHVHKNDFINVMLRNVRSGVSIQLQDASYRETIRNITNMLMNDYSAHKNNFTYDKEIGRSVANEKHFETLDKIVELTEKKKDSILLEQDDLTEEQYDSFISFINEKLIQPLGFNYSDKVIKQGLEEVYKAFSKGGAKYSYSDKISYLLLKGIGELTNPSVINDGLSIFRYPLIQILSRGYLIVNQGNVEDTTVSSPDGGKHFIYSMNDFVTESVNRMKKDDEFVRNKLGFYYNAHSILLNKLVANDNQTQEEADNNKKLLRVITLNMVRNLSERGDRGRHIRKISPLEDNLMKINAIFFHGLLPLPVLADRKKYYMVGFSDDENSGKPVISKSISIDTDGNITPSDELVDIFYGYYLDENESVKEARAIRDEFNSLEGEERERYKEKLLKNYHYTGDYDTSGGNAYDFIDFVGYKTDMSYDEFKEKFSKTVNKIIEDEQKYLIDINLIGVNSETKDLINNYIQISIINDYLPDKRVTPSNEQVQNAIKTFIADYAFNSSIGIMESRKLFSGNPALYKKNKRGEVFDDIGARAAGLGSSGNNFSSAAENGSTVYNVATLSTQKIASLYYDNIRDRQAELIYKRLRKDNPNSDKELLMSRAKKMADNSLEQHLKNVDPTDGQMFISPEFYKELMTRLGLFSDEVEAAFNKLNSDEELDSFEELKALNIVLNPLKTVYFGHTNFNGIELPVFDKMSMAVIFRRMFVNNDTKQARPILELLDRMELKGRYADKGLKKIHAFKFDSATKISGVKESKLFNIPHSGKATQNDFVYSNLNDLSDAFILEQNYDDLRLQITTDPHDSENMPVGTQVLKVALADVIKDGNYNGEKGSDVLNRIMRLRNAISNIGLHKVNAAFDIKNGKVNNESFANILRHAAIRSSRSDDFINHLKIDQDGNLYLNLDSFHDKRWVYSNVKSTVDKKAVNINTPGNMLIQVSDYGMGNVKDDTNLEYHSFKGGKLISMEARMSIRMFKHYFPQYNDLSFKELTDIIKNSHIEVLGYRVPTQGQSSVVTLRIKEILPEEAGDVVFLPLEFTALTGSDFDIDKLFVASRHYKYDPNKKILVPIEYSDGNSEKEIQHRYEEKLKELFEIYLSSKHGFLTKEIYEHLVGAEKREVSSVVRRSGHDITTKKKLTSYETRLSDILGINKYLNSGVVGDIMFSLKTDLDLLETKYRNSKNDNEKQNLLYSISDKIIEIKELLYYYSIKDDLVDNITTRFGDKEGFNIITEALAKAGVDASLDSFKNLSIEEQNTEKANINKMFDDFFTILKNENHQLAVTTPLGTLKDRIKKRGDFYEKQYVSGPITKTGTLGSTTPSYQSRIRRRYGLSKSQVAPFALSNVTHIIAEISDLSMRIPGITGKNVTNTSFVKFSRILGDDNVPITAWHSAMLDGNVDFVKDPYLANVNSNDITNDIIILLLRMGYGIKSLDFINQPIIRDFVEYSINESGSIKGDVEPIDLLYQKWLGLLNQARAKEGVTEGSGEEKIDLDSIFKDTGANSNILLDSIRKYSNYLRTGKGLTSSDIQFQLNVMKLFTTLSYASNKMLQLALVSRVDTRQTGSNPSEIFRELLMIKALRESGDFTNIDKILGYDRPYQEGDTFIPTLIRNSIKKTLDILQDKSLYASVAFQTILNDVIEHTRDGLSSSIGTINTLSEELISYFLGQFFFDEANGLGLTIKDVRELLLSNVDPSSGTNNLFNEIRLIKSGNHPLSEELKDNSFIKAIQLESFSLDDTSEMYNHLKMPFRSFNETWEGDDYVEDLFLMFRSNNPEIRKLATRLYEYAFFTSGFGYELRAFNNYLPLAANKEMEIKDKEGKNKIVSLNEHISNLLNELNTDESIEKYLIRAHRAIASNNWNDGRIVKKVQRSLFKPIRKTMSIPTKDGKTIETSVLVGFELGSFDKGKDPKRAEDADNLRKDLALGTSDSGSLLYKKYILITDDEGSYLAEYAGHASDSDLSPVYKIIPKKGFSKAGYNVYEYGNEFNTETGADKSIFPSNNFYMLEEYTNEDIVKLGIEPVLDSDTVLNIIYDQVDGFVVIPLEEQVVVNKGSIKSLLYNKEIEDQADEMRALMEEEFKRREDAKVLRRKGIPASSLEETNIGKNKLVANIPQNKISGVESYGSYVEANDNVKKILGNNPHSIDMIEAGLRTRTTRSVSEMTKYGIKVGDTVKFFGKSANGSNKTVYAIITAIHPKGTPEWKNTWYKEGWREEDVHVIDRFKDGAAAVEFRVISNIGKTQANNAEQSVQQISNWNPTNVPEEKRIAYYNDVISRFGKVKNVQIEHSDINIEGEMKPTYRVEFEKAVIFVNPDIGSISSGDKNLSSKLDIREFIGVNKAIEEFISKQQTPTQGRFEFKSINEQLNEKNGDEGSSEADKSEGEENKRNCGE